MKKIVLMVVAMFVMTAAFAENENNSTMKSVEAYDMTINMRKLAVVLDLNSDQMEAVQDIHTAFCNDMMLAAHAQTDERSNMVNQAVKKDMRYMHYILNDAQYKKYELLLITTLKNRGLK